MVLALAGAMAVDHLNSRSAGGDDLGKARLVVVKDYQRDHSIVLNLEGMEGEFRARWVVRSTEGKAPPDALVLHGEAGVAVWAPPGQYEVICTVAVPEWTGKTLLLGDLSEEFTVIEGVVPEPPLPPGPLPDPPGPPQPPSAGFADLTKAMAGYVARVKSDDRAGEAKQLAGVFEALASECEDGTHTKSDEVWETATSSAAAELGLNAFLAWKPALSAVRKDVDAAVASKRLTNDLKLGWNEALRAIAAGFTQEEKSDADQAVQRD